MKTEIPLIEPTPTLNKRSCRFLAAAIGYLLRFGIYGAALLAWYLYDLFYGVTALLLAFVIIGIVRANLRNSSVPASQQEYHYSDEAIAAWFVARRLLCDL